MSVLLSRRVYRLLATLLLPGVALQLVACAGGPRPTWELAPPRAVAWWPAEQGDELFDRFAPVFVTEHAEKPWNRIGTPSARQSGDDEEEVFVDPSRATVYLRRIPFESGGLRYTNLVYRVHFEQSPFTWVPFNAGAGRNVGLLAVVTLDAREHPVWVTTVHTCGCYHAVLPTNYLPRDAWPEDWDPEGLEVYGEQLPGLLAWPTDGDPVRLVVKVRAGSHRVMDMAVVAEAEIREAYDGLPAESRPIAALDALPLGESTTSFFHESGRKRGLVKGAWKPLETLMFGWWIRDFYVGRDRRYGPRGDTQLFYTTLNPARKERSDMWQFARFLELNGWKTGVVSSSRATATPDRGGLEPAGS
jgi:hypothetical protein